MPTPSEPTIPVAHTGLHSRTSFASCPPDERDFFASREPHSDIDDETVVTRADLISEEQSPSREESPALDELIASTDFGELGLRHGLKVDQNEDGHALSETASSAASPEASSDYGGALLQCREPSGKPAYYTNHLSRRWKVCYRSFGVKDWR